MINFLRKAFYKRRDRLVQNYNQLLNRFIVVPPDILFQAPAHGKVLVIAPHSDDEVIGCGGAIQKFLKQGSRVEIVIATQGEKGGSDGIVETRKQEARAAADILGVTQLTQLGFHDGNLNSATALKNALQEKIETFRPDAIFAPNIFDNHPDHIIVGRHLVALAEDSRVDFQCYFFEVWTPLTANVIIDITEEIETKTRAMRAHQSQQAHTEFIDLILGINRYRAIAALSGNPAMKYAEAFFRLDRKELGRLQP